MTMRARCAVAGKPFEHLALIQWLELHQKMHATCPECHRVLRLTYDGRTGRLMGFPTHRRVAETATERNARCSATYYARRHQEERDAAS